MWGDVVASRQMRGKLLVTSSGSCTLSATDLGRPPMEHPIHYSIAEHRLCLERGKVLPFNGDVEGIHNHCVRVSWSLKGTQGVPHILLVL